MNHAALRPTLNVVVLLATIAVNGLANALPLNGQTTGDISNRFPVRFVPAGYVFAIWGLIYLALSAFGVYQALPAQRQHPLIERISRLFALSCGFNIAWLLAWHYNLFPLTLGLMLGLLATLIGIYARLRSTTNAVSRADHWLIRLPFSIYLAWITVATIANACIVLYAAGWNGFGLSAELWAVILVGVGLAITAFISLRVSDAAYGLVILWAYIGIAVKQADALLIVGAAGIGSAIVALLVVVAFFRSSPHFRQRLT